MFPFTKVVAEWRIALSLVSDQQRPSGEPLFELKLHLRMHVALRSSDQVADINF
jgi:hypothetical protein